MFDLSLRGEQLDKHISSCGNKTVLCTWKHLEMCSVCLCVACCGLVCCYLYILYFLPLVKTMGSMREALSYCFPKASLTFSRETRPYFALRQKCGKVSFTKKVKKKLNLTKESVNKSSAKTILYRI